MRRGSIAATLVEKRLVREIRAKGDMPVWPEDEEGKKFGRTILKAGRATLPPASKPAEAQAAGNVVADGESAPQAVADPRLGKLGSKRALIANLLQRSGGLTAKRAATWRHELPPSTVETNRLRMSWEERCRHLSLAAERHLRI